MSAATALKKIQARVKKLRKKHPGAKFRTLQKQAGAEYRAGRLKTKRKPAKKKIARRREVAAVGKVRKRKAPARKISKRRKPKIKIVTRTVQVGAVKYKRRRRATPKKHSRRRASRIGGMSSNTTLLLVGAAAVLGIGYLLLRDNGTGAQSQIAYQPTGSVSRDNKAGEIMAWATAAGIGISAITSLISALNTGSDSKVSQIYDTYKAGGDPMAAVAGFSRVVAPYSDN